MARRMARRKSDDGLGKTLIILGIVAVIGGTLYQFGKKIPENLPFSMKTFSTPNMANIIYGYPGSVVAKYFQDSWTLGAVNFGFWMFVLLILCVVIFSIILKR